MGMKTEDLPSGTSRVFEGAASKAKPAAAKARAAHTPPIDIVGGRRLTLYSHGTPGVLEDGNENRGSSQSDKPCFRSASSKVEPAAAKARAAHTPPIDIIGGRRLLLYSDGTQGVLEDGNENSGPSQTD